MKSLLLFASLICMLLRITAADPIRGVNVGGWLILEQWLGGDIWNRVSSASDEWGVADELGDAASDAFQDHWSTWFTESTVQQLASYGVNTLRIPLGYWSVINNSDEPYVYGAQDYLDQAIGWARNAGVKVWVDLHGAPGSQNGYDNSGHADGAFWQTDSNNIPLTIDVITQLAEKYSGSNYSDVVIALELLNEPISWSPNDVNITRQYYIDAYNSARNALTDNQDLQIIIHDSFVDLEYWSDIPSAVSADYGQIGLDSHIYQVFTDEDNALDGTGHIDKACSFQNSLQSSNDVLPTYAGEWSAAAEICIYADGTSSSGTSCDQDGCQCTTDDSSSWNSNLTNLVRAYVEAQLDVFEGNATGYFFWSHTGPGAWNFINGAEQGWIPNPLTSRAFPGQCGFTLSSETPVKKREILESHLKIPHDDRRRVRRGLLGKPVHHAHMVAEHAKL
ncbi:glycoside hydrolase superfamily [Lipomyces japonicus]|uniref:glycoside hydrolase superfamily n=1 Tax=Lipomyces japonicus TaxID=56871 RepID=UPI0034CFB7CB